jgi:hypothetical protein
MPNGLSHQPKLLKGALVDIDRMAVPPLIVSFQFNPETIQRRRSTTIREPAARQGHEHQTPASQGLGEAQSTLAQPEVITMDIRLDATDGLDSGDPVTGRYGVLPALSALEAMTMPRARSFFGAQIPLSADFGFGGQESTPVIAFVWGRHRVYPVRLTELVINETEHSPTLSPTRVIASVTLQVLEGANVYARFTTAQRSLAMQLLSGRDVRSIINLG